MERTYLMVKPDGVQRGLCGEILSRFEKKGLKIVAVKLMVIPRETAEKHYGEHKGKPFFPSLISYITSGPV
ncbi:MAG: nucleoside-diphosphate kinase, partial [Candidatus Methanomethylophilaceae archaeon]|nr:nucleoside-diphosphate kinase [Candidatus Methanomethylophilaceae archaeon]